jgi:HEAT repeat protein
LREENAGTLWRAADAAGRCGVAQDQPLLERLKELSLHEDVRVRVTAAAALWRLTKDVDAALPILRRAMAVEDEPLAIGFVFPSDLGPSHRIYAIEVLGEMRRERGTPVLDDLVAAIEDAAVGSRDDERNRLVIGLTALGTLARCEEVPEETVAKVRATTSREDSVYRAYPDLTEPLLDELLARLPER